MYSEHTTKPDSAHKVRAVHCHYQADEDAIYAALKRATDPLDAAWEKIRSAKTVAIKFNQDWPENTQVYFKGQLQQLVSEKVARAVLRLLRERTRATLIHVDASYFDAPGLKEESGDTTTFRSIFEEFDVEAVDGNKPPFKRYDVPGGGQMFGRYLLSERAVEADAFVSVQKMKNHLFAGVTLCMKNLFGMTPLEPYGRARQYFHHLVRLPYVLADLGRIYNPTLNILDALVSQAGREWGNGDEGPPLVTNTLIAGDQVVATDACAARLMGHDPQDDWPSPPFLRDRNTLLIAAEGGFGTVQIGDINFQTEVEAPLGEFFCTELDPPEMIRSWRRTTAEQALYYRDNRKKFIDKYAGEYILLQEGEVKWHDTDSNLNISRRKLAGSRPEQAMWFKLVDPNETEGERFEVYERVLGHDVW